MRCVLALDQGGSKCEAALFRDDGKLLGWGRIQQTGSSGRSPDITIKAARQALDGVSIDELHVINLLQDSSKLQIHEMGIQKSCRVSVSFGSEHAGPLALVGKECGIVIVAGTGARLFGKNRAGREVCLDGLGPVLGDVGSGYQIGYLGLRASVRGLWHPRHSTSLTGKIFDACCKIAEDGKVIPDKGNAKEPANMAMDKSMAKSFFESNINPFGRQLNEMVKFSLRNNDRSVIASLAGIVDAEAVAGDAIAIGILHDVASQMAENIRDLADHLQIGSDRYVMVGTGSVAIKSDIYWRHLCNLVKVFAPGLEPVRSPLPPVAGMGLLRLVQLEGVDHAQARSTLFASVKEYLSRKPQVAVIT
jgi:N-acetylglucosamine kinase-like BadF-type ATPase